ncbi:MAG TPA: ester cyclase [Kribbella sp.]|uniref:ester cyclase n=1 Tax=Kribbella sp. TaxID=1871183 RepID=UPI002D79ED77|nr:ester cyclase [Kribbella sp.]HET6295635.1 ester cyclase [Kribbella sp.]
MSRLSKFTVVSVVVSLSASLLSVPMASASAPVAVAGQESRRGGHTAENKALVTSFYDQLFNNGDLSVIDKYVSAAYIQHNPFAADGPEALRALVAGQKKAFPQSHNTIKRVVAQGDLVLIHSHSQLTPGAAGTEVTDIFRVSKGKLVEHWDTLQPVPTSTASGNDLFSTLSGRSTPGSAALTLVSEWTVLNYFTRLNNDHDLRAVDRSVSRSLYQHDPLLTNGSAAVKAAYAKDFATNPSSIVSKPLVVAEGDLVAVRYHYQKNAADLGQAITEIFRVQHGKIVEHWSATQNVPATSANDNTMF